jgi:WD40 repeat protein
MSTNEIKIPEEYLCPITHEIMTDPVVAADGQTYDRKSITEWFSRGHRKSPLTGSCLPNTNLMDNIALRKIIREYENKLPSEIQQRGVRLNLEKCIQQKEEMIKTLIEKIDHINLHQANTSTDMIYDIKKENLTLKKQINEQEEAILSLKKQNNEKGEVILDLIKENEVMKKQLKEMNIQPIKLPNKKYTTTHVQNFKRCFSFKFIDEINGLLELCDGTIPCWTKKEIKLLKLDEDNLELIKSFNVNNADRWIFPIEQKKGDIIFKGSPKELTICDKKFKEISRFKESSVIKSLCNISNVSFAIGFEDGSLKIYLINSNTQEHVFYQYNNHSKAVLSLLFIPKQNYLLSGSSDKTINIMCLSKRKLIKTLFAHSEWVSSLLSLNDETFASGSEGEIKIWSIKEDIQCIKTIIAYEGICWGVYLNLLGNDFMISRIGDHEFKIWDLKTYQCLKTYEEDSRIRELIVTKNNEIITITESNEVNVWRDQTNFKSCIIF